MYAVYRKRGNREEQWFTGIRTWAYALKIALHGKRDEPKTQFIVREV